MESSIKLSSIKTLTEQHGTYIGTEIVHIKNKEFSPEQYADEMMKLFENVETEEEFVKKFEEWLEEK